MKPNHQPMHSALVSPPPFLSTPTDGAAGFRPDLRNPEAHDASPSADPPHWANKTADERAILRRRRAYAEIDSEMNAELGALDAMAELDPAWNSISLGGPVPPYVPDPSEWNGLLIVGKAPGDAEVAHGEPMTGRAGRLLDKILTHNGLRRRETAITNVFRMQAPWSVDGDGKKRPNDVSAFFTDNPSEANTKLPPLNSRYVRIGPDDHVRDLWRMIRHLKPKVVVALGEIAAWALTGDGKLTDRMGEPLPNDCSAAPVLITYRPAYALHARDEAIAALIAEHIQAAARLLTAGSIAE